MKYVELTIYTTDQGEELVANTLFECGADGVLIENRNEIIKLAEEKRNFDYIEESFLENLSKIVLLKMFIDEKSFPEIYENIKKEFSLLKSNAENILNLGSLEMTTSIIDDVDYLNVWKEHYVAINFKKITICPTWLKSPRTEEKTVFLDPATAFGTGYHETTSAVIELLEEENVEGKNIVDIGTGSGILGISAIKLGAKKAYMCDIDAEAVKIANENAKYNGVDLHCKIEKNNLSDGINFSPDIVLANITADILIILSKEISEIMEKGTVLIVSGILNEKLTQVKEAYLKAGYKVKKSISKKEWSGMALVRV